MVCSSTRTRSRLDANGFHPFASVVQRDESQILPDTPISPNPHLKLQTLILVLPARIVDPEDYLEGKSAVACRPTRDVYCSHELRFL